MCSAAERVPLPDAGGPVSARIVRRVGETAVAGRVPERRGRRRQPGDQQLGIRQPESQRRGRGPDRGGRWATPERRAGEERVRHQLLLGKDDRWLYLNTSGNKLADRGYRRIPHKAPMQETLAAAVIMATGYAGSHRWSIRCAAAARSPSRRPHRPEPCRPACCGPTSASCT